jgi:hypothetical protein
VCTDFKMLEVKVPIIFFPARSVFRYAGIDVKGKDDFLALLKNSTVYIRAI